MRLMIKLKPGMTSTGLNFSKMMMERNLYCVLWIIVAGTVIVKPCFKIEPPAGEHVGIGMVGVFGGDLAIDGVLVALDGIAVRIT